MVGDHGKGLMEKRFEGVVRTGYGIGAQVMSDPILAGRQAHHFTAFTPVPGTLNVLLPEPFDIALFTGTVSSYEMGGITEDHFYAPIRIEDSIPGYVVQTLNPGGDFLARVVELVADRHLRTSLGLADGDRISFELESSP
jgi:CTP-dependent riboflavin kinase